MKLIENNLCISGGASDGLAYFRLWKEIHGNDLHFRNVMATSAGVVMGMPIMFGHSPEKGKDFLKAIRGDRYMKYTEKIKKARWFRKPFMLLKYVLVMRLRFFRSCEKEAKKLFPSWQFLTRCYDFYSSFVLFKDVKKAVTKPILQKILKGENIREIMADSILIERISSVPVYYASSGGVLKSIRGEFKKFIPVTIPPWKVLLASFNNPILPPVYVNLGEGRERVLDGGIVDNYAVGLGSHEKDRVLITCASTEKLEKSIEKIEDISLINLKKIMPGHICCVTPLKKREFFDFTDETIESEYHRSPTEIF